MLIPFLVLVFPQRMTEALRDVAIAFHAEEGGGMDGRASDGCDGENEAAEPGGARGPGGSVDVIPAEGAGDDACDESGLVT